MLRSLPFEHEYIMTEIESFGAELMLHIKRYLDQRLGLIDQSGDNSSVGMQSTAIETFIDPFNVNNDPLSLSLPDAFARVVAVLASASSYDHVVIWVSSHSWEDFYRKLLAAAQQHPAFLDTAVSVQQRFGFNSLPLDIKQKHALIFAEQAYTGLATWLGRYDQVYSAVLIRRYPAGKIPRELLS